LRRWHWPYFGRYSGHSPRNSLRNRIMKKYLFDSLPRAFLCAVIALKARCLFSTGLAAYFTWADVGLFGCLAIVMAYLWTRSRQASHSVAPSTEFQFVLMRLWLRVSSSARAANEWMKGGVHSHTRNDCCRDAYGNAERSSAGEWWSDDRDILSWPAGRSIDAHGYRAVD
jgi:hypothetical protein